ncbi:MAG TPA: hypothetical protein VFG56_00385 [Candidatus Saccharimonadales bacterium]|nr:hypothetical protein [Candidatus Saccharimonadales bacterium]
MYTQEKVAEERPTACLVIAVVFAVAALMLAAAALRAYVSRSETEPDVWLVSFVPMAICGAFSLACGYLYFAKDEPQEMR